MNQLPYKMSDLKPWKSVAEQLAILKDRGLQVDNEPVALNYLARIGYYRLSGYWYPMREIDTATSQQQQRPVRTVRFVTDRHFEADDTEVSGIDTIYGRVDFLQFVGITSEEYEMLKEDPSKAKLLVEAMKKDNPYLVTDLGREKSYLV